MDTTSEKGKNPFLYVNYVQIMNAFFDYSLNTVPNIGFGRFGKGHILWLLLGLLLLIPCCRAYDARVSRRRKLRLAVAGLGLALELVRAGVLLSLELYDRGRLPLHLCTLSVYLCFLHALRPWPLLGQFLYAFTLPGAAFALVFPDWADFPAWHFVSLSSFLLHFLLVLYPLMLHLAGDIRPEPRRLPACLGLMLLLALPVYGLNKLWHTNYMFLNWPPPGTPLELFAALGRPGYLLAYLPLAALVWLPLYWRAE